MASMLSCSNKFHHGPSQQPQLLLRDLCSNNRNSATPNSLTRVGSCWVKAGSRKFVRVSAARTEMVLEWRELRKGIAEFYDESSGIWEDIWGDHMHHGFYDPDSTVSVSDHRAAQIRMIEESLRFAALSGIVVLYCITLPN